MKGAVLLSVLLVCACNNNNMENKANFEACVERAEQKYQQAFSEICIHQSWNKPGSCSYNIENKNALVRSKDNEITACATMFSPKK